MDEIIDRIYENQNIIRSICRTYFPDPEDQKDLFQEIVIKLWKLAGECNHRSKYSTWLYRVALITAITHKKRASRWLTGPGHWRDPCLELIMKKSQRSRVLPKRTSA